MAPIDRSREPAMVGRLAAILSLLLPAATVALSDRETLVRFFGLANGKRWRNDAGWKQAADGADDQVAVCSWHGIKCESGKPSDDFGVTRIELPDNQLSGKITKHLWAMPKLTDVNLRSNAIRDAGFQGFAEAKSKAPIKTIIMSENKLTSMEGIGSAPDSLTELHISSNTFVGAFPEEIFQLKKLKVLLATYNRGITGSLPKAVGNMVNLKQLLLWYNSMSGSLPTELGKLNKLWTLGLDENKFTGSLPTEMNKMVNLRYFSCQNFEDGAGTLSGPLPSFSDLVYLKDLYLDDNEITGPIPADFLKHSNVTDIPVTVGLMRNNITGAIPKDLSIFKKLQLDIVGNQIDGIPKQLCKMKQWMAGTVEQFGCDAILCPKGKYSDVGRQDSKDQPCRDCPNGYVGAPYLGAEKCIPTEAEAAEGSAHEDQQILVQLALNLNWRKWSDAGGWSDALSSVDSAQETESKNLDFCNFYGVTCSDSKRVTELNLSKNGLRGKVPRVLFDLKELVKLDLGHNDVHFDSGRGFGRVGYAKKLEILHMDHTDIRSFHGIGMATGLKELSIDNVFIDGPMSDDVFKLKNLTVLRCQFAGIDGSLPARIGELASLERLNLYGNRFSSSVPEEVGNLQKLRILDLSENDFTGTIPATLNGLQKLQRLLIHQSSRDGEGLTGTLPVFDNLPNLNSIRFDSNNLNGTISPQFLSGVNDFDRELTIGLSYNSITGTVPEELEVFSWVTIDLVGNKIDAISDVLCNKTHWNSGEVGAVGSCDAILCPKSTYTVYGMATSRLGATCIDCPGAEFMGTTFCDTDAKDVSEMIFLDKLYHATGGPNWNEPNSWTKSGVAACDYEGVSCEYDSVTQLHLKSFGLSGEIPLEIWSELPNLRLLELRNNSVSISFDGIEAATNLVHIDLSSTKVDSLEGIGSAPPSLSDLVLEWNSLDGKIASELFGLSQLSRLNLNHNHFSGTISSDISKLTNLKEFWCYNCDFDGAIPTEIGLLTKLEILSLGKNLLTGWIPTEFGSLSNLKSLALNGQRSGARISGPLYDFQDNAMLINLALSENAIAGTIPSSLLANVPRTTKKVQVDLFSNRLTGPVPITLDEFESLSIFLADNMITNLLDEFCDEDNNEWMDGSVGELGTCDAILCPKGYYSPVGGRQVSADLPCQKCPWPNDAPYFGSLNCGSSERGTLMKLFAMLNGKNWVSKRGWGTNKPLCSWHGVKCREDRPTDEEGISELFLEDNNIEATGNSTQQQFSRLFFQLPYLTALDLKGNNVQLAFDNIGLAKNLERLILSSTGLTSISGIGSATSLRELHLTDNLLNGTLEESGFLDLANLEHLFLSYNNFTGGLSSILGLPKLTQFFAYQNAFVGSIPESIAGLSSLQHLVLGENYLVHTIPQMPASLLHLSLYNQRSEEKISGKLPDFASLLDIVTLDLEENALTGPIPDSFLSGSVAANALNEVKVSLGHNDLTGAVPTSLDQFRQLDLGIVGTKITSIPESLCDENNSAWMAGAVGRVGSCSAIACRPYTWSETGRQDSADDPCTECPEMSNPYVGNQHCIKDNHERGVLMELFTSTRGQFWMKKEGWGSTDVPLCSWEGVSCGTGNDSQDDGIVKLDLEKFQLDGRVPTSIYQLPMLEEVNLRYNYDAIVTFEGIENATNLEVLRLSEVTIDSLDGIGQAPKLRRLHLTGCDLWGTFPDEIFDLSATLKQLFLAYNQFYGPLPTKMGQLIHLTDFFAFDNDLTGTMPTEIGNMKSLKNIVLAENLLTGQLPSEISSLSNLQLFSVFRRDKNGPKLTGTLPTFASVPLLTDLYLDSNEIGGSIPSNFLSSSSNIYFVTLANNKLTGAVPAELSDLPPFQLELEGNQISSVPDALCEKEEMMRGDVKRFGCDAILCQKGTYNAFGRQNSTDSKCLPCDDESGAKFWGSTSCGAATDQTAILARLFDTCGGENWVKNDNWKAEDVSVCQWHGISCNEQDVVHAIRLGSNNLVGTPPPELFDLPHLKWLWLHSNPIKFSFSNIGSATDLIELRLDSTGLSSVEGLEDAKNLRILDLRFNKLLGPFPQEVLRLRKIEDLSLADNDLRGQLPDIGGLEQLKRLRLGSNRFSGTLPSFRFSDQIRALDLSQNEIAGTIPLSFLEAVSIDNHVEVNLASNLLTGTVPIELDRFREMTLYLRDNKFTSLPLELCDRDNANWNSGDVGQYSCDAILCPPGTYSLLGRQSNDQTPCTVCASATYFGEVECTSVASDGWMLLNRNWWTIPTSLVSLCFIL